MKEFLDNVESGAGNALGAVLMIALVGVVFGFFFKPKASIQAKPGGSGCGCQG